MDEHGSTESAWTEEDQARADLVADIACELSVDDDLVAQVIDAYDERRAAPTTGEQHGRS